MSVAQAAALIAQEVAATLARLDGEPLDAVPDLLERADRVFVTGEGRSGLVMRMLAVRLMHAGLVCYVVGETTTPAIQIGDLLVACSGSGATAATVLVAETAARAGATVLALTATQTSRLAELASTVLVIPAPPKQNRTALTSYQVEGTLFEQCALVVCDAWFETLRRRRDLATADLRRRHANLE